MKAVMASTAAKRAIEVTEELNKKVVELNELLQKRLADTQRENAPESDQKKKQSAETEPQDAYQI